ncbi:MAG: hypothetical protein U0L06_03690 [Agathobacter sp.]|nr:hypothetical protein [Agathobacter sp.]
MFEFGAKLTLHDGMAGVMKKNIELQRQFREQLSSSGIEIGKLNKQKADPVITAHDKATEVLNSVRENIDNLSQQKALTKAEVQDEASKKVDEIVEKIKEIKKTAVSPIIHLKDTVSPTVGKIRQRLKEIATTYTPIVRIRDLATQGISKIKNTLGGLGSKAVSAVVRIKDGATAGINKVRVALATVKKIVATPVIKAKDGATKVLSKVKSGLKAVSKVFTPFVKLKDGATKVLGSIKSSLKDVGKVVAKPLIAVKDGASKVLGKIGSTLKSLAKGVTVAVSVAGGAVLGGALNEGAKLQQSTGGVETLFKGDADKVKEYANQAYQTVGISANEYLEQVTSFSASLLSSLGGDTAKSADVANTAMVDMADNANKFGTDMGSIQNAYQGFAKQNYTMLDNLKLGYGGTKEEMQRLLNDAQQLTGVKYNIDNLSDVYNAIHAIQENLGVAGTTADEASKTFSGAFAMMKASAKNLLGNLSVGDGKAVAKNMGELVESASTFFFGNFIPMLQTLFSNLPEAIKTAVFTVTPKIKENVLPLISSIKETIFTGLGNIGIDTGALQTVLDQLFNVNIGGDGFKGIFDGLKNGVVQAVNIVLQILPTLINYIQTLAPMILNIVSTILSGVGQIVPYVIPVIETITSIVTTAMPVIQQVITVVVNAIVAIMPTLSSIFTFVGDTIKSVLTMIGNHMGLFQTIVSVVVTVVSTVWQALAPVISAVVDVILTVVDGLLTGIETVFNFLAPYISQIWESICGFFDSASSTITTIVETIKSVFQGLFDAVSSIFGGIKDAVSTAIGAVTDTISGAIDLISGFVDKIGGAISKAKDFVGSGVDKVKGALGFAYGKDRVPYDNYPAILHAGEKVLTRNQADQYERQMSTRGVQLKDVTPLDRDSSGDNSNTQVQTVQGGDAGNSKGGNWTINIEGITFPNARISSVEDAENLTDVVVDNMVRKMKKILPNMT